jgi:integrase
MTVWKPKDCRTYRYRFLYKGRRFEGSTGMLTEQDASEWEFEEQRRVRRQVEGLAVAPEHSPRFTDWAEAYYTYVSERGRVRRMARIRDLLRVVLRFWGEKPTGANPKNPIIEGEPYHNLRLVDPARDPEWIVKFERWMTNRGISPQTKNHYRSAMSRMYKVALLPQFVKKTGVDRNPFEHVERDRTRSRKTSVTPAELRSWLQHARPHAQLAIAIAALAPKLRLANVLALQWDKHLDPDLKFITVDDHKTVQDSGEPLVQPISPALRTVLEAAKKRRSGAYVVMYRGKAVKKTLRGSMRAAAEAAGLTYGMKHGGVTFHTIRHTAATLLAEMPALNPAAQQAVMGHRHYATTQGYQHLRPVSERSPLNRLAKVLQLEDLFGSAATPPAVLPSDRPGKHQKNRADRARARGDKKKRSTA